MGAKTPKRRATLLVCVTAFAVGLGALAQSNATYGQQRDIDAASAEEIAAAMRPEDLEKAFWLCDYTATTHGIDATPVAICGAGWEEFKQSRFGGSFDELLGWWQVHKVAEHTALAARSLRDDGED
jgi:hypothetical protein